MGAANGLRLKPYRESGKYLLLQIFTIHVMIFASILNGISASGLFIQMIGYLNLTIGVLGCAYLFGKSRKPADAIRKAIIYANVCHILFSGIQFKNAGFGYMLTSQLYASPGRNSPLETMNEIGYFVRAFGATYSPTILGGYALLSYSYMLMLIVYERGIKRSRRIKNVLIMMVKEIFIIGNILNIIFGSTSLFRRA